LRALSGAGSVGGGVAGVGGGAGGTGGAGGAGGGAPPAATECPMGFGSGERFNPHY